MPISLDLLKTHGGPKRLPCHRNELLSHLKTDHSHTRCERVSDKILGSLGLVGNLQKILVSRKCLAAFIHLIARELSTRIHVPQLIHQRAIFLRSTLSARNAFQPVAEKFVQRGVLTLRFFSGQINVGLVGVKSDVSPHDNSVHECRVQRKGSVPLGSVLIRTTSLFAWAKGNRLS